jgi:UTP--glucose-1-phosphate uridylyltransferase
MKVTKAVFPVAGLGTRFLPATKAIPKEMLPIVDKPLIQYAVEEAIAAGINELIFVTSYTKRAIEDHFDRNFELETRLEEQQKHELLEMVRDIVPDHVNCVYIRQTQQLGLGHAVLCARPLIKDEPFAVLLADDLIDQKEPGCLSAMLQKFSKVNGSVLGIKTVLPQDVGQYGIIGLSGDNLDKPLTEVIEKPSVDRAPSNYGIVGRYILTPEIFTYLAQGKKGAGGEIQLTDAISGLMQAQSVYAYQIEGMRYDCGNKLGYLKATVQYGLKHEELAEQFRQFLKTL